MLILAPEGFRVQRARGEGPESSGPGQELWASGGRVDVGGAERGVGAELEARRGSSPTARFNSTGEPYPVSEKSSQRTLETLMSALVTTTADLPAVPADLISKASEYAAASVAPATARAYQGAWRLFRTWCASLSFEPLPAAPEVVALFISHRAAQGRKVSTITSDLAAIRQSHLSAGLDSPTGTLPVTTIMKGIRRTHGVAQASKRPILIADLRRMSHALPEGTRGLRDRAVLVVGFAGAFRRSELVALNVQDVEEDPEGSGLVVTLRRSKTDQEGKGRQVGLPYGSDPLTCPVRTLRAWMHHAGIIQGPLFRSLDRGGNLTDGRMSARAVARATKRAARAVGIDPARVAGHSLRSGFCTSAARAGAQERVIARQTGHKSLEMVHRYVKAGRMFDANENAAMVVGL